MRRKKKRNPIVPWIAAVAVLALAVWLLLANVVFVVRDVQVVGAGEVPEADVRHLSGIRFGARLKTVDPQRVRLDVESDGRVAFVGLEKRYPSRVVLTVRPRTMDAVILQGGKLLVLDSDAYVVQVTDRLPDARIPYVTGLKATYYTLGRQLDTADGRCGAMKAVVEALKARGATAYVSELNVSNTEDIRVISRTGMTVLLGNSGDMENKVAWMAGALADLEARGERYGQLDVSSGTKADFRPAESTQEQLGNTEEQPQEATEKAGQEGQTGASGEAQTAEEAPAS